ncbi:SecY subunit domain-containing protein [Phellopilus nigrolimitatus]|nr:SecY subunit domain-containing protein [Phellopilus nigrolimitatus]
MRAQPPSRRALRYTPAHWCGRLNRSCARAYSIRVCSSAGTVSRPANRPTRHRWPERELSRTGERRRGRRRRAQGGATALQAAALPGDGLPAQIAQGQRICRQCGVPGRYKDSKRVEKWGPGPEGPRTENRGGSSLWHYFSLVSAYTSAVASGRLRPAESSHLSQGQVYPSAATNMNANGLASQAAHRRPPTPPYINSISTREQYANSSSSHALPHQHSQSHSCSPSSLGPGVCLLLILQLATNTCESIVWKSFSPTTVNAGRGPEFGGAVIALFHYFFYLERRGHALREAFWCDHLPNIMNLISPIVVFGAVIHLQCFHFEIHVKRNRFHGQRGSFPVKRFYTSNMPIIFESPFTSNVFIVSQSRFLDNLLVRIMGAARGFTSALGDQRKSISVRMLFSKMWIEMVMAGHREVSMHEKLKCVILKAAAFGGAILVLLSVAANLNATGSGTGIIMAITIIYSYWEIGIRESISPDMAASF